MELGHEAVDDDGDGDRDEDEGPRDGGPDRCLVYEDADAGVTAALSAGMTAYNVRTGRLLNPGAPP